MLNKFPWEMTKEEWNIEREKVRPEVRQTNFTKSSASEEITRINRVEELCYGAKDLASQKMKDAIDGKIVLSEEELEDLDFELNTHITHRDVIIKALREGKPVSNNVLKDYPDL